MSLSFGEVIICASAGEQRKANDTDSVSLRHEGDIYWRLKDKKGDLTIGKSFSSSLALTY
jgi:hypothetical protein